MRRWSRWRGWSLMVVTILLAAGCDQAVDDDLTDPADEATDDPTDEPNDEPNDDAAGSIHVDVEPAFTADEGCFGIETVGIEADEIECGMVEVPQDYEDPDGPVIRLATVTLPGTDGPGHEDPVLLLGGGPGEVLVESMLTVPEARQFYDMGGDLIVIDQRGVGSSDPALECPEVPDVEAQDAAADDLEAALEALAACRERLSDEGIDLDSFNHLANANDVEMVRRALGHDQLNLRGGSYGTQVALLAAEQHPQGIRSLTLSSPVDPTQNWIDGAAMGLEQAIHRVGEACAADAACAEAIGDVEVAIEETVERLDEQAEEVTVQTPNGEETTVTYRPSTFLGGIFLMFYIPQGVSVLPALIDRARDGDLEPLAGIVALIEEELEGAITTGMQFSMLCSGEGALASPRESLAALDSEVLEEYWFPDAIIGGEAIGPVCDLWDVELAYDPDAVTLTTEVPALIVTGTFDHVTPPQLGAEIHEALPNSFLVEVPNAGHGALESLGPCGQQIAGDFLSDPRTAPADECATSMPLQLLPQLPPGLG